MPTPTTPTEHAGGRGCATPEDEFYGLYVRTRLMAAREFESFGMEGGAAASAARDLLDRLAVAFLARGSGVVSDRDEFADGVVGALGGRIGGSSERVWSYIAGELLPGLAGALAGHKVSEPGGLAPDEPLPPAARIRDVRDAGFFGDFGANVAPARRGGIGISPVIANLLAMSSLRLGRRARASLLGRVAEGSVSGAGGGDAVPAAAAAAAGRRLSRRKLEGVFYTPAYVARCMCRDSILPWLSRSGAARDPASLVAEHAGDLAGLEARLRGMRVLDPACGAGAFLIEAADALLAVHAEIEGRAGGGGGPAAPPSARALEAAWRCLYGMDKSPRSVEAARLALLLLAAAPDAGRPPPDLSGRIVARDSVGDPGGKRWEDAFPDVPRGGGFDVIVGNPPYVRHEELRDKGSLALPEPSRLGLGPGFRIPPKSDLAAYFHYHSLCHLAEGGRMAFIASDGWLGHGYGLPLQRALLDNCSIDAVVRPAFNVFGDASVKTAVLLLARLPAGRGHRVRFASVGRPRDLGDWRGHVAASPLQESICPGNWLAQFAGDLPPAPGIPMVPAASAGRVETCVKTGRNEFFVLAPGAARERGIAAMFLRPVLSRGDADGCLEGREAREYLFSADMDKARLAGTAGGRAALRYIEDAEATRVAPLRGSRSSERRIPDLTSVGGRSRWYSLGLGDEPPPIFISMFTNRRIKVYRNDGRFFARNNCAAYVPADPAHADALCAYFASAWFALHVERNGHVAGGGALQFLVGDFRRSPVPDLGRMGPGGAARLGEAWRAYCAEPDRGRLDDAVLSAMGFGGPGRAEMIRRLDALISARTGSGASYAGEEGR